MKQLLIALTLVAASICQAASAATDEFQQAKTLYKARKYAQAFPLLEKTLRAHPYDAERHMYIGLCYRDLGNIPLAIKHLEWASTTTKDPAINSYAGRSMAALMPRVPLKFNGDQQLGSNGPKPTVSRFSTSNGVTSFSGVAPASSSNAQPAGLSGSDAERIKNLGRCKVIMFETTWCQYCKAFTPVFDAAANRYRNWMDFEHIDVEKDPQLKAMYDIRKYPTLVYLDSRGKMLYQENRSKFAERLTELTGK